MPPNKHTFTARAVWADFGVAPKLVPILRCGAQVLGWLFCVSVNPALCYFAGVKLLCARKCCAQATLSGFLLQVEDEFDNGFAQRCCAMLLLEWRARFRAGLLVLLQGATASRCFKVVLLWGWAAGTAVVPLQGCRQSAVRALKLVCCKVLLRGAAVRTVRGLCGAGLPVRLEGAVAGCCCSPPLQNASSGYCCQSAGVDTTLKGLRRRVLLQAAAVRARCSL